MSEATGRVPADAVLQCLHQLCAEHAKRFGSSPAPDARLIATAIAERQRFTSLLEEALRVADGLLVDATLHGEGVEVASQVDGELDQLNSAVGAVLEAYNEADSEAGLVLKIENGQAVISGNVAYDSANAAQRAVRELLTALYHPDLREASLAGLVWADDGFDEQHRKLLWPLLMRLTTLLNRSAGTTLLLFAGDADIDFSLHCSGRPSLNGRINTSGYDRRRTYESNEESIRDLSRFSQEDAPLIVLFLGAGASVVDGLPTGNELRNKALARQVGLASVDYGNYDDAARKFYRQLIRKEDRFRPGEQSAGEDAFVTSLTLERVLLEEQFEENRLDSWTIRKFSSEHADVAAGLTAAREAGMFQDDPLVKLLKMRRRLVLITVNFDRVLEIKADGDVRAYVEEGEMSSLAADLRTYREKGGPVPLLKLHGDVDHPLSIVANIEETAGGLSAARLDALEALVNVMKEQAVQPWWFIGYSMRDLDLQAYWQTPGFVDAMVEHWVAPFVDPAVANFVANYRMSRWIRKSFGYRLENRLVTFTAQDFFSVLWSQTSGKW